MRTITFNELQRIKDSLSIESILSIANELNISVNCVQKFFCGHHFKGEKYPGIHFEPGPDGGLIMLDDTATLNTAILNCALKTLSKK
ncbi:hypothetical protein EZS27_006360 [termite gut metagenome]|uniref:DNA-binding protein n=1 Tax=termite gut metagenome TaxID=433724 RepID=A0A5J4SJR7_9ZZZZ